MPSTHSTEVWKGGPPPPGGEGGGGGGGGGGSWDSRGSSRRTGFTALYVIIAAIVMFFAAFVSAFVARRAAKDWTHAPLPPIVWINTGVLLASSVVLEVGRRALRAGRRTQFNGWWTTGTLMGIAFVVGQFRAWIELRDAGIVPATGPSVAFFYILTASHAAHVIGGVIALVYVTWQALRLRLGPGKRTGADLSAVYWHFLGALWVGLVGLLAIWG